MAGAGWELLEDDAEVCPSNHSAPSNLALAKKLFVASNCLLVPISASHCLPVVLRQRPSNVVFASLSLYGFPLFPPSLRRPSKIFFQVASMLCTCRLAIGFEGVVLRLVCEL